MKFKILLALLVSSYSFSQVWSTGEVALTGAFSVQFDVDQTNNLVTLTMTGPQDKYLAVAPGVSTGSSMGDFGDDVIVYNGNGLQDRHMTGSNSKPSLDASSDWTLVTSDDLPNDSNVRKVIATRVINSGDSNDFDFPTNQTALPILWALGSSLTFNKHANRGGIVTQLTLSNEKVVSNRFKLTPNPTSDIFVIEFPKAMTSAKLNIYDVMGKLVYEDQISSKSKVIDTNLWPSGFYLVKVEALNYSHIKRLIKN